MERLQSTRKLTLAAVAAGSLVLAACGNGEDFPNEPRPPKLISVTAVISRSEVSVDPRRIGAGPITLRVTNQTGTSQRVTLRSLSSARRLEQSTGPINPSDVASLKADLRPGSYQLRTSAHRIQPARLAVGARRPSAQNDLLQP